MCAASMYNARLRKEYMALQQFPPHEMKINLSEDNLHSWEILIPGPPESVYKGGKFKVHITIPDNYPLEPPMIHFLTPVYHLNVSRKCGQVCLGFLSRDNWVATATMEQIVNAVFALLIKPVPENSFDHDVLNNYHHFPGAYTHYAKRSAAASVGK